LQATNAGAVARLRLGGVHLLTHFWKYTDCLEGDNWSSYIVERDTGY
jgi:hypothetical protein